ncbi:hypothetical protein [Tahibacter amnicola]|uniref:Uncharacterized protein n=1 Tax=Tahibacter amnicola TaxID=2976241 RepID=A0ABY6BDE5_9GAMM|nr:hypothetical protein [Tahibacter amnicola]UXI67874.1 hypothetical protein N4264_24605 [Tahibacter amnicola]
MENSFIERAGFEFFVVYRGVPEAFRHITVSIRAEAIEDVLIVRHVAPASSEEAMRAVHSTVNAWCRAVEKVKVEGRVALALTIFELGKRWADDLSVEAIKRSDAGDVGTAYVVSAVAQHAEENSLHLARLISTFGDDELRRLLCSDTYSLEMFDNAFDRLYTQRDIYRYVVCRNDSAWKWHQEHCIRLEGLVDESVARRMKQSD